MSFKQVHTSDREYVGMMGVSKLKMVDVFAKMNIIDDIKECLNNRKSNLKSLMKDARKDREWKHIEKYLHKRIKAMEITVDQFHILRQYIKVPKVMRDPIMYYYYLMSEGIENPLDDEWYKEIVNRDENFSKKKIHGLNVKMFEFKITH